MPFQLRGLGNPGSQSFDKLQKPWNPAPQNLVKPRKPRKPRPPNFWYRAKPRKPRTLKFGYRVKPRKPKTSKFGYRVNPRKSRTSNFGYSVNPRKPRTLKFGYRVKPRKPKTSKFGYRVKPRKPRTLIFGHGTSLFLSLWRFQQFPLLFIERITSAQVTNHFTLSLSSSRVSSERMAFLLKLFVHSLASSLSWSFWSPLWCLMFQNLRDTSFFPILVLSRKYWNVSLLNYCQKCIPFWIPGLS